MKVLILYVLVVFSICGCTMTAKRYDNKVTLSGLGGGEAEFPDGTKIKKGLITIPKIELDN